MKRILLVLILVVTSTALSPPADAALEPTIVTCNFPVTKSIIVQNSLFNCPEDGLRVMADNVTIDLNGHIIDGNDSDSAALDSGIENNSRDGVVVRNGTLRDFANGVWADDANRLTLRDLVAVSNTTNGFELDVAGADVARNSAPDNGAWGFHLVASGRFANNRASSNFYDGFIFFSEGVVAKRNEAIGNLGDGFRAGAVELATPVATTLIANVSVANRGDGFEVSHDEYRLEQNRAHGNSEDGFNIQGESHVLVENVAKGNSMNGILATEAASMVIRGNVASGNTGDGIDVDVDGLRIVRNKTNRNGFNDGVDDGVGLGIRNSGSTGVTARRNRASGNADDDECSSGMACA